MTESASVTLKVCRLPGGEGIEIPRYMSLHAAGMDLSAAADLTLAPGARAAVSTGFAIEIPAGFEGQVRPRSGLSLKHGITVANAPGTIDADYRGELKVILVNLGSDPFVIRRGDRIAQLVIAPVVQVRVEITTELSNTARGADGFGSSGT